MMQPLSSVCEIIMGQAPAGDTYNDDQVGLPLIAGASDFGEITPKPTRFTTAAAKISRVNDIIVCVRATIGDLNWSDGEYCLGRGVAALRVNERKADRNYIWRAVEHGADRLSALGRGATFKQISKPDIADFEIPLPSLEEQKRIAAILDQADELRRKRQRALDRLNQLGQAIFYEMFGDPQTNPFGRSKCVLGDVVHSASDGPHVSPTYAESGIPFLSTRHVKPGEILWRDLKYLTVEDAEAQWKKCRPQIGDLLYTKGGTTGIAAVVDTENPFAVWVHVALLKTNHAKVEPLWLETMLNCDFCYRQSQTLTHGIANRDLGLKRMVNIEMYLPSLDDQRKFVERLHVVREMRSNMRLAEEAGQSFFASLQHRAFRGELTASSLKEAAA